MNKALIVVDVQNDFIDGSLPVPGAVEIIEPINRIMLLFDHVIFTRDWHPQDHISFQTWPVHCVAGTDGAAFPDGLRISETASFINKGRDKYVEEYSGFANARLEDILDGWFTEEVYVCGLATDYCVKATVRDALALKFKVKIILNACRGINPDEAIEEMIEAGAEGITL